MHADSGQTKSDAAEYLTLTLFRLPQYEDMSEMAYRDFIKGLTNDMLAEIVKPTRVLGQKRILNQDPLSSPRQSSKTPAPLCHTTCARLRAEFRQAFRDFVSAYKEAYTQLSRGHFKDVFPEGAIPPTAWAT